MDGYTKYIIVQPPNQSTPVAILFHPIISHNIFSYHEKNIVSAGFCFIEKSGKVQVFGNSFSLNKYSRKDKDPGIIQETIRPPQDYRNYDRDNCNIFKDKK